MARKAALCDDNVHGLRCTQVPGVGCNVLKDTNTCYRTHSRGWRRIHAQEMMHTQVMEGICTVGTLEEGEVVWQVRTRTRILHTQTHRSTGALHMHALHTQRELCAHRCTYTHCCDHAECAAYKQCRVHTCIHMRWKGFVPQERWRKVR